MAGFARERGMNLATPAPRWFWIAAIAAVLFEAYGCIVYLSYVTANPETFPADQQALWKATPVWVTAAFAIAVWSGLAGSAGLLLRRRWAVPLLGLSLLAVIVQMAGMAATPGVLMTSAELAQPLGIAVVCALIYGLAHHARRRGWLRS